MRKAARRRQRRLKKYFAELSYRCPQKFEIEWNKRLVSWLYEIQRLRAGWEKGCADSRQPLFDIVDRAMAIIDCCSPEIRHQYRGITYELLSHEGSVQVARTIDRRIYKLNILDPEYLKALAPGNDKR
jgi:hypothetical protein